MKKIFIGLVLLALMFSACYKDEDITSITGTVRYIDVEGGFWGIIADNGEHYDPINLADALKKEGLRARFTLKILHDQASIHMWGTVVEILNWEII